MSTQSFDYTNGAISNHHHKHLTLHSFLNDKDLAMTSIDLDDDVYDTSSISSYDYVDSPRCERFNNNVYIISSRSKDGTQPSDTFINEAMSFPLIVDAN
jgi:hypothetical protein